MSKKIVIVRGVPGSGKSTFVKENLDGAFVCSADDYFEGLADWKGTSYLEEFKPWLVSTAHQFCWGIFIDAVFDGKPLIVVDNTNIHHWEYENYRHLGKKMGYEVDVVKMPAVLTAEEYHSRNTHGVPLEVIERMMAEYE